MSEEAEDLFKPARAPVPDYLTAKGAAALKAKIEAAWEARGVRPPTIELVQISAHDTQSSYTILRSDMVDALPPSVRHE